MSNMSYCRFQNTCEDLADCKNTMAGDDEHYQNCDDLPNEEYDAFKRLVEICKDIVKMSENESHVFINTNV